MKKLALLAAVLLVLAACGGKDGEKEAGEENREGTSCSTPVDQNGSPAPSPTPNFALGKAILDGDDGSVLVNIEIAETGEQHSQGLMFRSSLDEDCGMLFVFFEEMTGGFYMKNTLIPLSIAFFDIDGTIVKILDMEPCKEDPCTIYEPGVAYHGALEVNKGAFSEWGIEEGDPIRIVQNNRNKT
ncbi:MAG: DUF192 domain-containing protein [Actinobacteria bacterium]|nr:DUF192 domain-containing protein [Actinomycetota bacterium]